MDAGDGPVTRRIEVTAASHIGLRRERNEDFALLGEHLPDDVAELAEPHTRALEIDGPTIVAAIDGLGGHPGGDVASRLTARHLHERRHEAVDVAATRRLLVDASDELFRLMDEPDYEEVRGMGATIAGIVVAPGDEGVWFNLGDARTYVLAEGALVQLSEDDSPLGPTGGTRTAQVLQTVGGSVGAPERRPPRRHRGPAWRDALPAVYRRAHRPRRPRHHRGHPRRSCRQRGREPGGPRARRRRAGQHHRRGGRRRHLTGGSRVAAWRRPASRHRWWSRVGATRAEVPDGVPGHHESGDPAAGGGMIGGSPTGAAPGMSGGEGHER
ncbi:MAG: protein phosphatase 2C domain-containing protein [Acidimicrobiia bacterium]|nr:protein phosphatase 2C domain-containing protein [Acidimicrobiia bacterium]